MIGTTVVTMLVRSADSLVFSLTLDPVIPIEFLELISSTAVYQSSVAGSENSRMELLERR